MRRMNKRLSISVFRFYLPAIPLQEGRSDLEIEAGSDLRIWTDRICCYFYMRRMYGITLKGCFIFEAGIQHQICIGRVQAVNIDLDVDHARDLSGKALEACLDVLLDLDLILIRKLIF